MSDAHESIGKDELESPASEPAPLWSVGIVNHGSYDDLENCLESLARQTKPASAVAVYDTGIHPEKIHAMRAAHPWVDFEVGPNLGYAGGANRVLSKSMHASQPVQFCLILNPDVVLDPDYSERLIETMTEHPSVAIAGGKLLRPGRRLIDTAGICFPRHRRPRDRGSEEEDRGQFDECELVDAISGAAMMIRSEALEDLQIERQLFDEDFFAYHEDTDLCWRAQRFGWQILYEPRAVGIHVRGWQRAGRAEVAISTRRHSFKNHYLQVVKNETLASGLQNLPWLLGWEILRFGFVVLRDRAMLGAYAEAWRTLPGARRKRRLIQSRARRVRDFPPER